MSDRSTFAGRRVIITGGLGFIGSNLAVRLVDAGADVTIVDCSVPGCGANPYNIAPIQDRVRLIPLDMGDAAQFAGEISRCDLIFNLAGEISHTRSMEFPERDLAINAIAQLRFLLACRDLRPGVRVVFASTRQVYGRPNYLPVDEAHPVRAIDFNGIHKLAAAQYHLMLSDRGEINATVLRLTNVYGPRMALNLPWQGFLGTYVRMAMSSEPLAVFGEGEEVRDPVYVDDVVEAFLLAGGDEKLPSRIYNVGGPEPLSISRIAETFASLSNSIVRRRPFPKALKAINIGSYYTDSSLINRHLNWRPVTQFEEGVRRTLEYYRPRLQHYLTTETPHEMSEGPQLLASTAVQ